MILPSACTDVERQVWVYSIRSVFKEKAVHTVNVTFSVGKKEECTGALLMLTLSIQVLH